MEFPVLVFGVTTILIGWWFGVISGTSNRVVIFLPLGILLTAIFPVGGGEGFALLYCIGFLLGIITDGYWKRAVVPWLNKRFNVINARM